MTRLPTRRLLALALASAIALPAWAQTTEPGALPAASTGAFTATDIRIDGLQRISAGTVLTYLPIERGDTVDSGKTGEAIRALYKTGFFEDVKLDRQGDGRSQGEGKQAAGRVSRHHHVRLGFFFAWRGTGRRRAWGRDFLSTGQGRHQRTRLFTMSL